MSLVEHARRELEILGEDEWLTEGILKVVQAFSEGGHSGSSAPFAISYIERLLRYQPLSPLTANPDEWEDRSDISGVPLWQSRRNPEAFSEDGGATYHLLSENVGDGVTPVYYSEAS